MEALIKEKCFICDTREVIKIKIYHLHRIESTITKKKKKKHDEKYRRVIFLRCVGGVGSGVGVPSLQSFTRSVSLNINSGSAWRYWFPAYAGERHPFRSRAGPIISKRRQLIAMGVSQKPWPTQL